MAQMDAKFRLLGWQGLVGMAVSGLDMAFWDALGQAAGQPLATLLGGSPRPIRAYDSYGAVDPVADEKDLRRSLDQGFRGIKIKGGDGDLANDERVVKAVRGLIGPDIALMLDFNQSLDPSEASRRIERLAPYDLHWIEEPVAAGKPAGPRQGARDLADLDSVRRELVVSARLCRSDRSGRERFHHARSDEGRRRHRLAPRRRPGRGRLDSDVEPPVRRSQLPHAGGDADRALARGVSTSPAPSWPNRSRSSTARSRRAGHGLGLSWDEAAVAKYLVH